MRRVPRVALAFALGLVVPFLGGTRTPSFAGDPTVAPEKAVPLPRWKAGEQEGTVTIDGKEEGFAALVPKGYSPKHPVPVVLLCHGNGGKALDFLREAKTLAGKKPPLLVALERCDNKQDAVGYAPKYLVALQEKFAIDPEEVFALGFSGGGFRLWDDVVCQKDEIGKFRGVVLVGSAKQSFEPADKPARAPTILLIGDPNDPNFKQPRIDGEKALKDKGYEVLVFEHAEGHSMARAPVEKAFGWIADTIKADEKARKKRR